VVCPVRDAVIGHFCKVCLNAAVWQCRHAFARPSVW
jgi:hypothetical protein